MDNNDSIPRSVAKWLLVSAIDLKTTSIVANTADNYTRFDRDDLIVKLGAGAVGMVVASGVKPVTDKIVDKTADFAVEKWTKFRAKKNAKKQEK